VTQSPSNLRPLIPTLYLPALAVNMANGLLVPILPLYAAGFEISYGLIGLILAGEALGTLIADVPTGMIQERFGNKQVMMMGFMVTIVSTLLMFFVHSIWLVFILRITSGFGRAMYGVSMYIYIANHVEKFQRGKAIAIFGGIHRLGGFIGPAIGGIIAASLGLRAPFVVFAMIGLVGLAFITVYTQNAKDSKTKNDEPHQHKLNVIDVLRSNYRILASAGTAQVFGQMIRAGRTVIIPLFAADMLGLGVDQIGFIVSLSVAVDFSLFLVAGWLMDRYGRKFAIVPCFSIQALGMALVPLTISFTGLLFAAILIGFGNGLGSGTMMTLGADLSPEDSRGEFLGVWRLIGDVGHMGGPLVVGTVADLLVLNSAIWVIAGSGFVAASIFLFFVPETLKRKK
jgi:MFS family permease